jgi:hypothetical protein
MYTFKGAQKSGVKEDSFVQLDDRFRPVGSGESKLIKYIYTQIDGF